MTAGLALGLYLLGLALAFGLRTVTHWRRTGDVGWRLTTGGPRTVSWWAKLLLGAAVVLGAAGPVSALVGLDPVAVLDRTIVRVAGGVVAALGIIATLVAQMNMGASWRIGVAEAERTALVIAGMFGWVRNPTFTAMIGTSLGLALMVPNPVSLAATALLIVAVQLRVRGVEEPYLRRVHGEAYAAYAASVGRFVPAVGRIRTPGSKRPTDHRHGHQHGHGHGPG